MFKRITQFLVEKKIYIILIVFLISLNIISIILQSRTQEISNFNQYKSIPHINLSFNINKSYYQGINYYSGSIAGFVLFDNSSKQPKDLHQYYIIEPAIEFNKHNNQIFYLEEILKMQSLPPTSTGEIPLTVQEEKNNLIVLSDEFGNKYEIDIRKKQVIIHDGDKSKLITNNNDCKNYKKKLLNIE